MANLLPNGKQQFSDGNGKPYALGTVWFYVVGTLTPKDTYKDQAASILNTNPVSLDANGEAVIFGTGSYRQILKDSLGNTIWDQVTTDGTGGTSQVSSQWCGPAAGTANAISLTVVGGNNPSSYVPGTRFMFAATATNTGPTTVAVSPLGGIPAQKGNGLALVGGEILTGQLYEAVVNNAANAVAINQIDSDSGNMFSLVSAATLDLKTPRVPYYKVTGNGGPITAITMAPGQVAIVQFTGTPSITGSGNLVLSGGVGVGTVVLNGGDVAIFVSDDGTITRQVGPFGAASTAEAQTGTDQGHYMTPALTKAAIVQFGGFSTGSFQSTEQAIATGTLISVAHGLGATPTLVQCILRCKTAEHNYSVGDEVTPHDSVNSTPAGSNSDGFTVGASATNVFMMPGATDIVLLDKTTGVQFSIDVTKWKAVLRAWL